MNASALLAEARRRGIELRADGDRLRYEAPEGTMTPELREALSGNRAELLALLRDGRGAIRRRTRGGSVPLSFAQERLWFMREIAPQSPFYNVPVRLRLRGRLDVAALAASLGKLVTRHETLRTSFTETGQTIEDFVNVELPLVDLSGLPTSEREEAASRLSNEEASRPFDLSRAPLVRARLFRISESEHSLGLTLHHIISDGWSMSVLLQDLAEIYDASTSGREERLPELPIQYADFALWQRENLSGDVLARQVEFWRRELEDLPALSLPFDHPRPKALSYRGGREWLPLPHELSLRLRGVAAKEGVTLYTALLAAFFVLLHRYTGEDDVFVGSPFAGRSRTELEGLIGFFVNSLILRVDLSGEPSFRELLARAAKSARGAFDHRDAPFEKVVDALDPGRDLGKNPLFQVVFALQNAPETSKGMGELEVQFGWAETGATRFDLEAHVWDDGSDLRLAFVYSSDLFDPETIRRMERHYVRLLEEVVEAPGRRISELRYSGDEERARAVDHWNRTAAPYPREATVHGLFEEEVSKRPDAEALVFEGGSLSYDELDRRANRLARFLERKGVGLETAVGLSLDRGVPAIVAILAILKAGGAYVPVDPELPLERRRFLLEDAGATVLVTDRGHRSKFDGYRGVLVDLDEIGQALARESGERPGSGASASNLAYVMYTSGSTGRPKGVAVSHRSVVRLVKGTSFVEVSPEDVFLQLAPIAFDASTFEIWGSLLNGGRLYLYPDKTPSLEELGETLCERAVTTLWLTGTLFHQMVEREIESLASVRQIVAGGEALSPAHVQKMIERLLEGARLVNGYGPTEGTTFTCCHVMSKASSIEGSVPIGRPIENTRVYVLDRYGVPVPPGIPGELYVGGDGLARGYVHSPELTAEKFVPDSVSGESGARLYRTGDLCRFLEDGTIAFLGRADHQVKVRGFRIELAEVERAFAELPEVAEAVVVAREDAPGSRRLVAYVVPSERAAGTDRERQHVTEWTALFDDTYRRPAPPLETDFDFSGWNSSYTGEPIPEEEMREWLDETLARILARRPSRVLEIGCGTGLLLYRIAPGAERYVGWDVSSKAIRDLRSGVASRPELAYVELFEREALDFAGIEPRSFDTVILNSVAQYFPSAEYLVRVLENAVEALAPGGRIFVGDVRALALLEAFHTEVELERAKGGLTEEELAERVLRAVEEEGELVLDPAFFHRLKERIPRVSAVEVFVKKGRHRNELTRFRYDAFLHVERADARFEARTLDWDGLDGIRAELRSGAALEVRGIPNGRLTEGRVDPEDLRTLAAESGYALELTYSALGPFHLDALFRPEKSVRTGELFWPSAGKPPELLPPVSRDANQPLRARVARALVPHLRNRLQELLPEYMVPQAFVLLDRMPVGPTGKVDRKALPSPSRARTDLVSDYEAPRSEVERTLARIWSEVLGLDRVGVRDNFFELGGDSILGIQIVSRAKSAGLSLAVRQIFEHQTISDLASAIKQKAPGEEAAPAALGPVPLSPIQSWFFELDLEERHHFNQALLLELRSPVEPRLLRRALRRIPQTHDALRLRFREDRGVVRQELTSAEESFPLEVVDLEDLRALPDRATRAQRSLDLERGPVARAVLFRLTTGEADRLLLAVHHLVVDAVSWRVLVEDLDRLLRDPGAVLSRSTPFATWARGLRELADGHRGELPFWLEQDRDLSPALPRDRAETLPDFESLDWVALSLGVEETEALLRRDAPRSLVRALVEAVSSGTGRRKLRVALERHGREDFEKVDLSRTVGWFTSMFPFVVDLDEMEEEAPDGGIGYGLLRYVLRLLPEAPRPEISFTYLGKLDAMFAGNSAFQRSKESSGLSQSPKGTRPHLIDVTARTQDRKLTLHWYFSGSVHDRETIEELAGKHLEFLRRGAKVEEVVPLTPIQRCFLEESLGEPDRFNQALFLRLKRPIAPALLAKAIEALHAHHDAFRLRYRKSEGEWLQVSTPGAGRPEIFLTIDLGGLPPESRLAALRAAADEIETSFSLSNGPLFRAALFELGTEEPARLFLAAHHLVVDGFSWRILLSDLESALDGLESGAPPRLPPRTTSFAEWARRLRAHASADELEGELEHWTELARLEEAPLPRDYPRGENLVGSLDTVTSWSTEEETTSLLQRAPQAYSTRVEEALLAALVDSISAWTGRRSLLLTLEAIGREDLFDGVDLSRTVGWFTSLFPAILDVEEAHGPGEMLKAVKEQVRSIPARGIGYGLLRYSSPDETVRARLAGVRPEVAFNYLGRLDSVLGAGSRFALAPEPIRHSRSPRGRRRHTLELTVVGIEGKLRFDWTFSRELHRRETIERLSSSYLTALRALIAHCLEPSAGGYTPSDFALAGLSQAQLDAILREKTSGRRP